MKTKAEKQAEKLKILQEKRVAKAKDMDPLHKYGIDEIDVEIMLILASNPKIPCHELAAQLGMCERQVWTRRKRDRFKVAFADMSKPILKVLEQAQRISAQRMVSLAASNNAEVAMEAGKLLLKPLLGENNNLNVNHRVTVKTRIGPDGKLNQEQTVEEINGNIPSDTISLSTEEIEAMELIENEKKNGSEV